MDWKTIDCQYLLPRFAASFLLSVGGKSVFVENNTTHAVPLLIQALRASGNSPESVEWLVVTHAHLDHAGGTSALAKLCPNATVLAHPKAAKSLREPTRLIESAKKVYGEAEFLRLYGTIEAIPANRIREVKDEETLVWQGRTFEFLHTLGHASHHFCMIDRAASSMFTGDAFGVCYPDLRGRSPFHFPSSSPIDFDAVEAMRTLERLTETQVETAYLTHFGPVRELKDRAKQMKNHIQAHQEFIQMADESQIEDDEVEGFILSKLTEYFKKCLEEHQIPWNDENRELLKLDLNLNASGLAYQCLKRRKQKPC
ncbi:MAG: MBL fold metallo-hydrolase [Proteobacteria bacterium]|nr:MBL fold metallo-hydrolase [Pseudomonadota bacterium]NDC22987.1 MBL fold metallo-hydrolase [Pseudomonadota bacterium]NDD05385.1 MBL fold metallo-hydrolase [Pseudomonadota bacterium]NDG26240.1 MBL fold metallo-hydrolase [Pseudomonadota bacterium]